MPNISFEERQELDKKSAEKRSHFQTSIKISADDFKRIIRNCQEGAYTNENRQKCSIKNIKRFNNNR